jgi:hypothetical protein
MGKISSGLATNESWDWGTLTIRVSTNANFSSIYSEYSTLVRTGETSANYYITDLPIGTYYMYAYLTGQTITFQNPNSGDPIGEYSNGLKPSVLGGTGTPAQVSVPTDTAPVIDINWQLNDNY